MGPRSRKLPCCARRANSFKISYNHTPNANFPMLHESLEDVRIVLRERLGNAFVCYVENQEGFVRWLYKSPSQNEFTPRMGLPGESEMLGAKRSATVDIVVNQIVN